MLNPANYESTTSQDNTINVAVKDLIENPPPEIWYKIADFFNRKLSGL